MVQITQTHIHVGLSAPVRILHITDVHLTETDSQDTQEHHQLEATRKAHFAQDCPSVTTNQHFEEAIRLSQEQNMLLVNTGDAIDIHTHGNIAELRRIIQGHDMMFTPGGHEHQRVCRRTMEEEYPYWETVRPQLQQELPEFDLDFSSRIINGLNIVCADNSLDYYSPATLARFKQELERGLPILVFSHDPIWDGMLQHKVPYHPNVRLTPADYEASHEMMDLLLHHPLVIATIGGHGHRDEQREIDGKLHYMSDGLFRGACRSILIT